MFCTKTLKTLLKSLVKKVSHGNCQISQLFGPRRRLLTVHILLLLSNHMMRLFQHQLGERGTAIQIHGLQLLSLQIGFGFSRPLKCFTLNRLLTYTTFTQVSYMFSTALQWQTNQLVKRHFHTHTMDVALL